MESSSGADLIGQNEIKARKLDLEASSGSDLEVEVVATEIEADASSGADIKISGQTDVLYADASSGADIKARNLSAKRCNANASSGSDISVNVSEALTADASSGADISYSGNQEKICFGKCTQVLENYQPNQIEPQASLEVSYL